jgi:NodT family efflux transporter outer membrane factor (OMF) lipoprotein
VRGAPTWGMGCGLLLSACSLAPVYTVPSTSPPAAYREDVGWNRAQPGDELSKGTWWSMFQDPALDELERKATDANQNLNAAFARLQQARADTRIARSDLFPHLTGNASAMRARQSPNAPTYIVGKPTEGNDFVLEADLSYEVDLWGRVRNQVASARATQQASAADLASLGLSIQAELASDYFRLRSLDTQQQLLDKTVADYAKSLDLTQTLFDGGAAALSDVAQAKTQLHNAETRAADTHLSRAQLEHAIAVLIGENPTNFQLAVKALPLDASPPPVDPGLPSLLLERRPDVAEAERRVAAANAQIGVARAAYFPQLTLNGSGGVDSVRSSSLIGAPSLFWGIGPQVTVPIFEGGRLVAQTEKTKAAYTEEVALYRNTVLVAFQDVEDNLVALRQLEKESTTQGEAVEAAATALGQSQDRYTAGIVTYLEVATTETAALQAQLDAIDIRARRFSATVMLIKALGGGWSAQSSTPG